MTKPVSDFWTGALGGFGHWMRALLPPVGLKVVPSAPRARKRSAEISPQKRQIDLGGVALDYTLILCRRKSVGLRVGLSGLTVRAPSGVQHAELTRLLHSRARWILRQLQLQQSCSVAMAKNFPPGVHGGHVQYLGESLAWICDPSRPAGAHRLRVDQTSSQLCLALPTTGEPEQVRAAIGAWLREQAQAYFSRRLARFSALMGVQCTRLALSNARTRWGSANRHGVIRLNWRLMHLAPDLVDYVVVHELAHLRFMHHGPEFWQCVAQALPDFKQCRQRLRGEVLGSMPP